MPSKLYVKGVRKERKYVNQARAEGKLSFRSAGSHSPIDVVIIDKIGKVIKLLQCKPESMNQAAKNKLYHEQADLSGQYWVQFDVV